MIKIIDNFLDPGVHEKIERDLLSETLPWNYVRDTKYGYGNSKDIDEYQLIHSIYSYPTLVNPETAWIVEELNAKLDPFMLIRAKINLLSRKDFHKRDAEHTDHGLPPVMATIMIALYYVNNNNGYTIIGEERVDAKANRVVIFEDQPHYAVYQTDTKERVVVNLNYIPFEEGIHNG